MKRTLVNITAATAAVVLAAGMGAAGHAFFDTPSRTGRLPPL